MNSVVVSRIARLLCAVGVALHLYTVLWLAQGGFSVFKVGLLVFSVLPYAIAALLTSKPRSAIFAPGAAAACLLADLFMHYAVFVAPKGSTAAVGLVVMPLWNLLIIGPAGAVLCWLGHRLLKGRPRAD